MMLDAKPLDTALEDDADLSAIDINPTTGTPTCDGWTKSTVQAKRVPPLFPFRGMCEVPAVIHITSIAHGFQC